MIPSSEHWIKPIVHEIHKRYRYLTTYSDIDFTSFLKKQKAENGKSFAVIFHLGVTEIDAILSAQR